MVIHRSPSYAEKETLYSSMMKVSSIRERDARMRKDLYLELLFQNVKKYSFSTQCVYVILLHNDYQ